MTKEIIPQLFDQELLIKSNEERFEYFEKFIVAHDRITQVKSEILRAIRQKILIIIVIGPTRVGKSALLEKLKEELEENCKDITTKDPTAMPVLSTLIRPIENKNGAGNQWAGINYHFLEMMGDPFLEGRKRAIDLSIAVEKGMKNKKTKYNFFDEAQHLVGSGAGVSRQNQMDYIKSRADTTKITHIMFGTNALEQMTDINAQLGNRIKKIYFSPYDTTLEDIKVFSSSLYTLLSHLPIKQPIPVSLVDIEYFYTYSQGCIGALKEWLGRALTEIIYSSQDEKLTQAILDKTALEPSLLLLMQNEIMMGKATFSKDNDDKIIEAITMRQKWPDEEENTTPSPSAEEPSISTPFTSEKAPEAKPSKSSRKRNTGTPHPKRYPTGDDIKAV